MVVEIVETVIKKGKKVFSNIFRLRAISLQSPSALTEIPGENVKRASEALFALRRTCYLLLATRSSATFISRSLDIFAFWRFKTEDRLLADCVRVV